MEMKFNLKESQVYIPSGRIMNMKRSLKWDDIEMTISDINNVKSHLTNSEYKTDETSKVDNVVNKLMNYSQLKKQRELSYLTVGKESVSDLKYFAQTKNELVKSGKEMLSELMDKIQEHPEIIKRIEKLKVLQQAQEMLSIQTSHKIKT